jgi:hypothetical protein
MSHPIQQPVESVATDLGPEACASFEKFDALAPKIGTSPVLCANLATFSSKRVVLISGLQHTDRLHQIFS